METSDQHVLALQKKLATTSYDRGANPSELLNHFLQTSEPLWMGSTHCQSLLQQHAPRLALESDCLLHAMLAFSSSHIAALRPEQHRYETAGALHYSHALQSYRKALNDGRVDADALFACCMLLTLLSFKHLSDVVGNDDNLESQGSLALDTVGIRFLKGPRILSDAFAHLSTFDKGIWKPLIRHCDGYSSTSDGLLAGHPSASQSMAGLEVLCRGGEASSPYDAALTSIRLLMESYVSNKPELVEFTFCFAIQLDPRFLRLVEDSVPKALLVLCYWYALVAHVEQWWACRTAHLEGLRLLRCLQDTQAVRVLLEFPAQLLKA